MADVGNDSDGTTSSSTSSTSSTSSSASSVGDSSIGNNDTGGGSGENSNNSTNDSKSDAQSTNSTPDTTTSTESQQPNDSLAAAITASLNNTVSNLGLSLNDPAKDASKASRGAVPSTMGEHAVDAVVGHFGKSALQGVMAGLVSRSGKTGLSAAAHAAANPAAIASALTDTVAKGYGMDTTAHNIGGMLGSHIGTVAGPVGAVVGGLLGTIATEGLLDMTQERDNEVVRDVLENELGPLKGRRAAAEMSDLSFSGFLDGLMDPSLGHLSAYTAGVLGQVNAIAGTYSDLGDPAAGIGITSDIGTTDTDTSLSVGNDMGLSFSNLSDIVDAHIEAAKNAPDRSGEIGWGNTAPSISAPEASMEAPDGSSGFTPINSYGWLRTGLPVFVPSSLYRSSYWDGTRFVNMNDYRGFM